ncbi:MAG: MFS transporter [Acidobacteria bacterium]|nr:MFS transporter [Acidobacteriota bacterium]
MALSLRVRAAYAAPGLAFALIGIPVYVHLPKFYADTFGVDLAWLGLMILASRVWDAVTDPALGFLSDRTRTRLGRRRPYLLIAPLPLAAAATLLLAPPDLSPAAAGWWFGSLLAVTFLAWTATQIPHAALGPELTFDHHERTALFAWRDGLWILGTLFAAAAPTLVRFVFDLPIGATGDRATFRVMALAYAPLLVLLPWWCALVIREPSHTAPTGVDRPVRSTIEAWENRPFRLVLLAYAIGALGGALPATLILFYVEHVLEAASLADGFLGLYFLSGFVCLPLWTAIARRTGKKRAWISAMVVSVVAFFGAAFLGPGDTVAFGVICVVSGIGFGAGLVLPASIVADVVDYDEWRSGRRREGLYYGLWSIATKVSAAVGAGIALPLLKWAGYVPQAVQDDTVLLTLRLLYAAVPCACYALALAVIARFPIDATRHRAVREALVARSRGIPTADPLAS